MDILVTFEDGTTELRAANSPALFDGGPRCEDRWPAWTIADVVEIEQEAYQAADHRMTLVFREGLDLGIYLGPRGNGKHSRRGTLEDELCKYQTWKRQDGSRVTPLVWTERWGWRPCIVESVDEQIARLTRERDAALCHLRAIKRAVLAWLPTEPGTAVRETRDVVIGEGQ